MVLVSPGRLARPWRGQRAANPGDPEPGFDPCCYLCPGKTRANGDANPGYSSTFVFDNDEGSEDPTGAFALASGPGFDDSD
jgi:UDPglucose--hexose-1-phosphate uridylyltransferase